MKQFNSTAVNVYNSKNLLKNKHLKACLHKKLDGPYHRYISKLLILYIKTSYSDHFNITPVLFQRPLISGRLSIPPYIQLDNKTNSLIRPSFRIPKVVSIPKFTVFFKRLVDVFGDVEKSTVLCNAIC